MWIDQVERKMRAGSEKPAGGCGAIEHREDLLQVLAVDESRGIVWHLGFGSWVPRGNGGDTAMSMAARFSFCGTIVFFRRSRMSQAFRCILALLFGISLTTAVTACRSDSRVGEPAQSGGAASPDLTVEKPPPAETSVAANTMGQGWSFDAGSSGAVPDGWRPAETNGAGTPATWEMVAQSDAPSAPNVFGVTSSANYGATFNVALADGARFQDLDLSVAVSAVSGEEDQGGGPVWRAADSANYYIARWNPLEKNFRLYFVKDGRRKQLATAAATGDTSAWHVIRVVAVSAHIDCYFDGEKLLSVDDETFAGAGLVGLWTKADAAALFDDLHVTPVGS